MNAAEISARLAERIEDLAETLLGAPPTFRTRATIRYYPRGGLVITTTGPERGIWCSHGEGGIGGDALDLVKHLRHCTTREAIAWATDWLACSPTPRRLLSPRPSRPDPDHVAMARQLWREAAA